MRKATGLLAAALLLAAGACSSSSHELARDCRGHDLVVARVTVEQFASVIELRNSSNSKCSLRGYPRSLTGTNDDGSARIKFSRTLYTSRAQPKPGDLGVGKSGVIVFERETECFKAGINADLAAIYHDVQMFVPGGGVVTLDGVSVDGLCGLAVTRLGVAK